MCFPKAFEQALQCGLVHLWVRDLDSLDVNGSGLTWRGWISWEGCFHQCAGEGGVSPVANLGWGREEGGQRGII